MNTHSVLNTLILAGIFVVLMLIYQRMPPTMAELGQHPTAQHGKDVYQRCPIVYTNLTEPLQVEIENTPLPVTIER